MWELSFLLKQEGKKSAARSLRQYTEQLKDSGPDPEARIAVVREVLRHTGGPASTLQLAHKAAMASSSNARRLDELMTLLPELIRSELRQEA